ncbi:hypothetical protein KJ966_27255 [bacterium]|nr:hypothetical protein [bacterium]
MTASFPGFLIFGAMSVMLLLGVFLRAKIKFLQSTMVPAALIGGVIGFILISLGWLKYYSPEGAWVTMMATDFLPFTFHAFNISFISLCLTRNDNAGPRSKVIKGGLWLSFAWCASLTLQALVGGGIVFLYDMITGGDISVFLGYLVTHGFTQGPGQAFAIGKIWESAGIQDATTMGLIWAAFGFLFAYLIGIPMARNYVNKGLNSNKRSKINEEFLSGLLKKDQQLVAGKETTHSSSVETLAYHMAIIGIVYILTYALIAIVRDNTTNRTLLMMFAYPTFFFHAVYISLIVRKVMDSIGIGHLTDPGMQKRITGLSVDYLLVSSIMGISLIVLTKYLGVIIAVCIGVTVVTYIMVRIFASRLTELSPERAVTVFGCACGSTASGLLLLRVLDADFSTSVGLELAFFNVAIFFIMLPVMPIMFALPTYGHLSIVAIYGLYTLIMFAALWFIARWKPSPATAEATN